MQKFLAGCGITVGALFIVLVLGLAWYGMKMESGDYPDTVVLPGNKLSAAARKAIDSAITLRPGETIQFFYSAAMFDWEADGNLVTNQRVVSYETDEETGEMMVVEANYADIEALTPSFASWPDDTTLIVEKKDGELFFLLFSDENEIDHAVVDYVQQQVEKNREQE